MPASTFGRAVSRPRWPNHNNHDLPKPIRRRRPPFFLLVDPRASAVRSSALAGRERAPVTRATPSSPPHRQTCQHEAEVVRGRQGSHIIRRRLGAAWSLKQGQLWAIDGLAKCVRMPRMVRAAVVCLKNTSVMKQNGTLKRHGKWRKRRRWTGHKC